MEYYLNIVQDLYHFILSYYDIGCTTRYTKNYPSSEATTFLRCGPSKKKNDSRLGRIRPRTDSWEEAKKHIQADRKIWR